MTDAKITETDTVSEQDQSLLKVSGSKGSKELDCEYVKKLANAILKVFSKHDICRLRSVGAASVNNAEKAFIIASIEAAKNSEELVGKSHFVEVDFGDYIKTGIIKEIVQR